jgi:phosphoribosylaminoimidazolecarboxamide formyltransferase/IMP cyclohydrolase
MKHLNPSGAAQGDSLSESFLRAWYCDFVSAFGSVVGFNKPLDKDTASILIERLPEKKDFKYYIEVVAAPEFEEGAMGLLEQRKDLRIARYDGFEGMPRYQGDAAFPTLKTIGSLDDMIAVEDRYLTRFREPGDFLLTEVDGIKDLGVVTKKQPTQQELESLLFAWYVSGVLRSNSVALVKSDDRGLYTISAGTGKQARNFAVEDAIAKVQRLMGEADSQMIYHFRAGIADYSLPGAVCASEALFSEPDSVYFLSKARVRVFAETGGSKKDDKIIEAANQKGMTGIFTGERWFSHH